MPSGSFIEIASALAVVEMPDVLASFFSRFGQRREATIS